MAISTMIMTKKQALKWYADNIKASVGFVDDDLIVSMAQDLAKIAQQDTEMVRLVEHEMSATGVVAEPTPTPFQLAHALLSAVDRSKNGDKYAEPSVRDLGESLANTLVEMENYEKSVQNK